MAEGENMFSIKKKIADKKEMKIKQKEELKKANNGHEFFYIKSLHPMSYCMHCKQGHSIYKMEDRLNIITKPCLSV